MRGDKMAKHTETENSSAISTFTKQQLLKSQRYSERRDLLSALLKDEERYSHDDIEKLIDEFMKGTVV
jgi:hypothetical protein